MIEHMFALWLVLCSPQKDACFLERAPPAFVSQSVCTDAANILRDVRARELGEPLTIKYIDCKKIEVPNLERKDA